MYNHSYHQRYDSNLTVGTSLNSTLSSLLIDVWQIKIPAEYERTADQHDIFLSDVQRDGFAAVASAFSWGVLNMSRLEQNSS